MKSKTLNPIHPNIGLELAYQRKLEALIEDMHRSLIYYLVAAYRKNQPEIIEAMAADASPAATLRTVFRRLATRWQRRFNVASEELAKHFALSVKDRSDAALQSILRKGGFSVKFKQGRVTNDVLQAAIAENVSLIKSIPKQHLTAVEGMVMRSVQAGRDLKTLSDELQNQFGVTWRRAELIARDQNNKITGFITRARQLEIGINEAYWVHSGGGRQPRLTHVKAGRDRIKYDVRKGWYDPAVKQYIIPGELINCRCISRPVLPI